MPRPVFQFLIIIFLSFFSIDLAISRDVDEIHVNRLKGWEGIVLQCHNTRDIGPSTCANIKIDAEFLATASGIKFHVGDRFQEAYDLSLSKNYLTLQVQMRLLSYSRHYDPCDPCVITYNLKAYAYYTNGINISVDVLPNSPMAIPRSGEFILWDKKGWWVFSSSLEGASSLVTKSVEKHLKEFFTLFMKANPK